MSTLLKPSTWQRLLLGGVLVLMVSGCAAYPPTPISLAPVLSRAQTQENGKVRVRVVALSPEESQKIFGVPMAKRYVQPVWVEIKNSDSVPYWFLPHSVDVAFFSPDEAAYRNHRRFRSGLNKKINQHFQALSYNDPINPIAPDSTVSGFVFTRFVRGGKNVKLLLVGPDEVKDFNFVVRAGDPTLDLEHTNLESLYTDKQIVAYDEVSLWQALKSLPCCTSNPEGTKEGDPLNLVFIGHLNDIFAALVRAGWHEAERLSLVTGWHTVKALFLGRRYEYTPISKLYAYGRKQDLAFQKARDSIQQRNHIRLWLTPMRFEDKPVWIGQVSRDIGSRFTTKTWWLATHKIDPQVDEARKALTNDLMLSQGVRKLGFVAGVGAASKSNSRKNLTGDPYYTDGLRIVMMFSDTPTSLVDIDFLEWDTPPSVGATISDVFTNSKDN